MCTKCGAAIDTVHHRLYTCAMVKDSALETLGPALFSEAAASGAEGLFFTRLMVLAHQHLTPAKDPNIKHISFEPHDHFSIEKGKVYIDGSCSNSAISCIRRAGFLVCRSMMAEWSQERMPTSLPTCHKLRSCLRLAHRHCCTSLHERCCWRVRLQANGRCSDGRGAALHQALSEDSLHVEDDMQHA